MIPLSKHLGWMAVIENLETRENHVAPRLFLDVEEIKDYAERTEVTSGESIRVHIIAALVPADRSARP